MNLIEEVLPRSYTGGVPTDNIPLRKSCLRKRSISISRNNIQFKKNLKRSTSVARSRKPAAKSIEAIILVSSDESDEECTPTQKDRNQDLTEFTICEDKTIVDYIQKNEEVGMEQTVNLLSNRLRRKANEVRQRIQKCIATLNKDDMKLLHTASKVFSYFILDYT